MKKLSMILVVSCCTFCGVTMHILPHAGVRISPMNKAVTGIVGFRSSGVIRYSGFVIGVGYAYVVLGDQVTINLNEKFKEVVWLTQQPQR